MSKVIRKNLVHNTEYLLFTKLQLGIVAAKEYIREHFGLFLKEQQELMKNADYVRDEIECRGKK